MENRATVSKINPGVHYDNVELNGLIESFYCDIDLPRIAVVKANEERLVTSRP